MAINLANLSAEITSYDDSSATIKCSNGSIRVAFQYGYRGTLQVGRTLLAHGHLVQEKMNNNSAFLLRAHKTEVLPEQIPEPLWQNSVVLQGFLANPFELKEKVNADNSTFKNGEGTIAYNQKNGSPLYFPIECHEKLGFTFKGTQKLDF